MVAVVRERMCIVVYRMNCLKQSEMFTFFFVYVYNYIYAITRKNM